MAESAQGGINQAILLKLQRLYSNTLTTKYAENQAFTQPQLLFGLNALKNTPGLGVNENNIKIGANGSNLDGSMRILELRFDDHDVMMKVKAVGFPTESGTAVPLLPSYLPERYEFREYDIFLNGVPLGADEKEIIVLVKTQFDGQHFDIQSLKNIPFTWGDTEIPTNRWVLRIKMRKQGAPLKFNIETMKYNRNFFPQRHVHFRVQALKKRFQPQRVEVMEEGGGTDGGNKDRDQEPGTSKQREDEPNGERQGERMTMERGTKGLGETRGTTMEKRTKRPKDTNKETRTKTL